MHTAKITRTLALAGCAPAGKLSHLYGGLLPVLALLDATLGKLNRGKRAYAVLVLCAATAIGLPAQTFTTLFSFDGANGATPSETLEPNLPLIQATNGDLYGTTGLGGANGLGTFFKITPAGALTTLYSFSALCCSGGNGPVAFVQATSGDFYGTTYSGGATGYAGAVFKFTPAGALTTLYNFCSQSNCTDGYNPNGLIQAANGDFYGTTEYGGAPNQSGTIFKITPSGTLTTLHTFEGTDGAVPFAGLVQATNGDFYGTTSSGGANGCCNGTVFEITPSGAFTTLYSFCSQSGCADGSSPSAALVQATDGNFYGTAAGGGTNGGGGTVFKITPGGTLTTLYSFCSQGTFPDCTDGAIPDAPLAQDTDGSFYGTTPVGGGGGCGTAGCGTIFRLSVGLGPFVETRPRFGEVGEAREILGTDLTGATSVSFNGTAAAFTVISPSLIAASVPAGATSGTVQVVTPSGTLSSNVPFRVVP